ncbi:hypothetical protein H4S07_002702 [Coemansia furcata]|uniref:Uncharacterized protein n=1 Tax=Coemansia furcata TaxID=417177 RepID=A0ACC1LK82_9FUNG|nr:hypothetical protein H4S07_002702 [Coemansia furcata]
MFAGGALLSSTIGYVWVLSHMERAEAVQRRLQQVQRHMYWSMAVTQRSRVDDAKCNSPSRQRPTASMINRWWNSKVSSLSYWVVTPGYLSQQARLAKSLCESWVESEWNSTKVLAARSRRRALDYVRSATKWNEITGLAHGLLEEEKAKWQRAHAKAIEAVHPLYLECKHE